MGEVGRGTERVIWSYIPAQSGSSQSTWHRICVQKVLESLSLCSAFPFMAIKKPEEIMAGMNTG